MELFFSPLSCSLAPKIALKEAGIDADVVRVKSSGQTKTTEKGEDYFAINPRGQVPALRLDDGEVLSENVAVLEYIADLKPEAGLAPEGMERHRVRRWLAFVNSELHTSSLGLCFSPDATDEVKAFGVKRARKALAFVDKHLEGREWLTDAYSVADIYLAVVANWTGAVSIDLNDYPNVKALQGRVFARPAAAALVASDFEMYQAA